VQVVALYISTTIATELRGRERRRAHADGMAIADRSLAGELRHLVKSSCRPPTLCNRCSRPQASSIHSLWLVMLWVTGVVDVAVVAALVLALIRGARRRSLPTADAASSDPPLQRSVTAAVGLSLSGSARPTWT